MPPLPDRRRNIQFSFRVNGQRVHLGVGLFPDGSPGEVFIDMHKTGTAMRAWCGAASLFISKLLQHGVPLASVLDDMSEINSEAWESVPVEGHAAVVRCTGVLDCVAQVLRHEFLEARTAAG